jgi:hypothetical protein
VHDIPVEGLEGLALKVRPAGNIEARRIYQAETARIPRSRRIHGLDPADERAASDESIIGAILVDWSGVEDDDGNPIPYSRDKAREIITDPSLEAFREAVLWASVFVKEFGEAERRDAVGNLPASSTGKRTSGTRKTSS